METFSDHKKYNANAGHNLGVPLELGGGGARHEDHSDDVEEKFPKVVPK